MTKKIFCIFIVMLLIATTYSVVGTININDTDAVEKRNLVEYDEKKYTLDDLDDPDYWGETIGDDDSEREIEISVDGGTTFKSFFRVIDAWGTTLRYDYYDELEVPLVAVAGKKTFPVITSAGPDKKFGTPDDISNK